MKRTIRYILSLLLLMCLGVGETWGQTDYSGTYYIRNMQNTNAYWYLVPCMGGGYYNDNEGTPYLTTYQTNKDMNSLWRLEKVNLDGDSQDYYRFIHNATGKYITANEAQTGFDAGRFRFHLQTMASPDESTLFILQKNTAEMFAVRSKNYFVDNGNNSRYWWDLADGNKNNYWTGLIEKSGCLGLWSLLNSPSYNWEFETATPTCATPVITYDEGDKTFSIAYPIAADGDVKIHYTIDGSEPTADSPVYNDTPLAEGAVGMVRAIAVKEGYVNSAVADFFSPSHAVLFKTMDAANQSYYMIPPLDETSTTDLYVTTSNVPNARMGWLLELAERSGDIDYYYFKNQATGQHLYCKATNTNNGEGNALVMKPLDEAGTEAERYKFRLWRINGNYFIVPQKYAYRPPTEIQNGLTKQNATDHTNPIGMYKEQNDGRSYWQFIPVPSDPKTLSAVSMASTNESTLYWKIQCVADNTFYVCPPAGTDRVATAQKTGANMEWFLEQATDADTWVTYYHIRNGETGEYLYFKGIAGQEKTFYVTSTEAPGSDDGFKFIVVRTANASATNSYNIIPKALKDQPNQVNNSLNRNNTTLRTQNSRNNNNSQWNFVAVENFVSPPDITYDNGQITLTCNTKGAAIYYTTDGSDPATSSTRTPYTAAITPTDGTVNTIKACATKGSTTSTVRTKTINLTTYTQGYYALHLNGTGYLKVNGSDVALSNDGTFRSGNLFGDGNSIWVITPEGYLQNEYYYLNVANNRTLYLSVTPETRWTLEDVANSTKKHLYINDGTQNLYLCNDGGIKVSGTTTKYYSACPMTVTELENGWSGPTTDALTLLSPQQMTYLRHYFTQTISYSFTNDAGGSVSNTNNTRRIYATLEYSSTSEAGKGSTWDIEDNIIYSKQPSGNVAVTAKYKMLPADPIARSLHTETVEKDIKFTLQPKAFRPAADTDYLLFHTNNGSFRFPYDDGITEGQPVKPYGTKSQLTWDPKNPELSWHIETDEAGFVMFKNVKTGRYLYFDAADYTNSDYGAVKVGATSVPGGADGTKYKFRLFKLADDGTFGSNIVSIIPYEKQFVIFKNDGRTNNIFSGLWADTNNRVLTLNKPADYKWKFYPYEVEDKYCLKTDYGIEIPSTIKTGQSATITATGTYDFKAESYHWLNIKGAPGNNNTDLDAGKGTKKDIVYQWEITGEVAGYIETLQFGQTNVDKSTFKVNVTSMPEAAISGKLKVTASVTSPEAWNAPVEIVLNIAPPLNYEEPTDFEEITSLSAITKQNGHYRLTADATDRPSVEDFKGVLDGGMHTVSGLSASLFKTLSGAAVVRNLTLKVETISGEGPQGAVAGQAQGNSRIYNVGVLSGSIGSTNDCCGGLVGSISGMARVINCFSYANITGGTDVGGIVGYNDYASTSSDIKTMVMNCMFYGDITDGGNKAPIYNGKIITNRGDQNGVGNYNYFWGGASYVQNRDIQTYNCALMAETRFLQRFEFFRHLLNSHRELAAWWATGSTANKDQMMKWVLLPSQIGTSTPYPILKTPGYYPSVVNIDAENAPTTTERNKGGKLGTLSVTIQSGSGEVFSAPTGASITKSNLTLNITDKDPDHFNFNYYKVQLPYYNDVGTGNYTGNRVVTGWKIVSITGGTPGTFSTSTADAPSFNFADRNCTNKDLYSVSGRVFNQGAYWDVPEGVTGITIQPYWAKAAYVADAYPDVVYNTDMSTAYNVPNVGGGEKYKNNTNYNIAGEQQKVFTSISEAVTHANGLNKPTGKTVHDYAVVLVGNVHQYTTNNAAIGSNYNYTVTTIDLDHDNEPDYSLMLRDDGRNKLHPAKWDFLNIVGLGMAQKSTGGTGSYNQGIFQPLYWFETTNTSLFRVTQLEYDNSSRIEAPLILQGGVMEQWVSGQSGGRSNNTTYFHVGGNVWFKEFHRGTHQDQTYDSKHPPVSVTGGDYNEFYLTGLYTANVDSYADNAECYINGGRFGVVAGAAMEGIGKADGADNTGNITWQVQNADIREFYAGGINAANPVTGNLSTTITGGKIDLFCGGPKFGDMSTGKTVTTNATNCIFGTFFGAGYGGNSYSRQAPRNHNNMTNFPHNDGQAGNDASWNAWLGRFYTQSYSGTYGGVSTQFSYQFLPMSQNKDNCGRIFVEYVKFSLATCRDVTSTLTGCKITGNFYGGGSLGKVDGPVASTLTNCEVQGSVFGAGFSASLPSVEVDATGFATEPYYYTDLGTYREGVKGPTTTYTWKQGNAIGIDKNNHILYTTENLSKTNLGSVSGAVTLTITGSEARIGGSVYGGGEESGVDGNTTVTVTGGTIGTPGKGGAEFGNVYGGGKGLADKVEAGLVKGNTNITISGTPTIYHNVYGGGAYGSVGDFTYDATGLPTARKEGATGGTANITITGGTIGTTGNNNGMVFGSSRGDVATPGTDGIDPNDRLAWVYDTHVVIGTQSTPDAEPVLTTPSIKGSVYGSGENGHTFNDTEVIIHSGTIGIATGEKVTDGGVDYEGAAYPYRGNVYGGGCGTDLYDSDADGVNDHYNPIAGIVRGDATVTIDGGHVVRNVYGAGAMGSVGNESEAEGESKSGKTTVTISGKAKIGVDGNDNGNVYGAARGDLAVQKENYANIRASELNIEGNADIKGSAFGGGEAGIVWESVAVNMKGGSVANDVYGGGALANTQIAYTIPDNAEKNFTTNVNLTGGTIGHNVYGGGLGRMASTGVTPVEAKVYGKVLVALNGTKTVETVDEKEVTSYKDNCVVKGSIFGCNNQNGSPQDAVTVHIYKTQGWEGHEGTAAEKKTSTTEADHSYHLAAVYGGGNLAAFMPDNTSVLDTLKAHVIIDGCGLTSIKTVYGGGNAASVPATDVLINGTYEIEEVFGGGNGKDAITINGVTKANPGANVGYKNYTLYDDSGNTYDDPNYDTKEERTAATSSVAYGSGAANVTIGGGTIHRVFGGSNTKGNVRITAVTMLEEAGGCGFCVDEAYGGGKEAPMDAEAKLLMACIPGLTAAYGGAQEANIEGGVTLTITNGTFDRVFGGNNISGTISGPIVVNIEETGCRPIVIGKLYGGGNEAAYSVYGYKEVTEGEEKVWKPRESATDAGTGPTTPYAAPQVNIKSFTSIGEVYGGGYGTTAVMVGSPTVNINVAEGKHNNTEIGENATTATFRTGNADAEGGYPIPSHVNGKIGAINNVYGGGDAAPVKGDTYVNIATKVGDDEYMAASDADVKSDTSFPKDYYTRSGEGTEDSPYTYTAATGTTPDASTTYYKKYTIKGVDIRGNVYGGGNQAEVTGDTHVQIGKKVEP